MSKEAMKLALEALEELTTSLRTMDDIERGERAITALEKALAEQPAQQEPVAYIHRQGNYYEVSERFLSDDEKSRGWTEEPLYTSPPAQRTWVGLTDAERIMCRSYDPEEAVAKTEAKLREKNA